MMVASASTTDSLVIDVEHFQTALDWLLEAEDAMPEIFKAMNTGGDSSIIKDVWYWIYKINVDTQKGVPEERVIAFLSQRVPSEKIRWILDVVKNAGLVRTEVSSAGPLYVAVRGDKA